MKNEIKEKNLAYGGQALIEGVLMRGKQGYAFTVKKPDNTFYKEKQNYTSLGKKYKIFGFPLIRGIVGLFESLIIGSKVIFKSADIAFPEEKKSENKSNIAMIFTFIFSLLFALLIFKGIPYLITPVLKLNQNSDPILYNLVAGLFSLILFFGYIISISFLNDTKRLFGYHGAEHKTINTYEAKEDLTVENVKKNTRLHPRCGTSFIFIVFIISLIVFPFFNYFFVTQDWYNNILTIGKLGNIIQRIIHIISHIIIGMPIVAAISYELLKLSQKYEKNPIIKIFISPGLFFQLFTTRDPDDTMIKSAILSLKILLGKEEIETKRNIEDNIKLDFKAMSAVLLLPLYFILI